MFYLSFKNVLENILSKRSLFVSILLGVLILAACAGQTEEPPGVGEKAERGYAVCNSIIEALEQYKTSEGVYPASLDELVPDYASSVPTEVNDQPIVYSKGGDSFSLSFGYIGPGMNICTYSTEEGGKWHCSGAY